MGLGAAEVHDAGDPSRFIPAQGGNYRHIRHAEILARWPVLAEPWAQRVETPGRAWSPRHRFAIGRAAEQADGARPTLPGAR